MLVNPNSRMVFDRPRSAQGCDHLQDGQSNNEGFATD